MIRCPKCSSILKAPAEHPDGLPGVLYETCGSCGYSSAVTKKPRRERLPQRITEDLEADFPSALDPHDEGPF